MKNSILAGVGVAGGCISLLFGGIDSLITTLFILMVIDYLSGLAVAGLFHKSPKSENGSLESKAGWKGLCRKAMTILFIVVAHRLDLELGTTYIRDGLCVAYICNEAISLIENAGLMGVPIPEIITNAVDLLKKKEGEGNGL